MQFSLLFTIQSNTNWMSWAFEAWEHQRVPAASVVHLARMALLIPHLRSFGHCCESERGGKQKQEREMHENSTLKRAHTKNSKGK